MDRARPFERHARGLFACRACLYELDQRVLEANMRQDAAVLQVSNRAAWS
ncbi:hypothetical protein QQY24_14325 [Streptomyces sp. TG1A-8]|nr:hypothetical protein [Streptomyces sp. TG1A-8]MDO0926535.1 hypothetical protein [Streptomyces sp. TG1A-8]